MLSPMPQELVYCIFDARVTHAEFVPRAAESGSPRR
jgi:hypothetical protein